MFGCVLLFWSLLLLVVFMEDFVYVLLAIGKQRRLNVVVVIVLFLLEYLFVVCISPGGSKKHKQLVVGQLVGFPYLHRRHDYNRPCVT